MRSLIDKLVFEVFDFDYVKKNQSNNTNECAIITYTENNCLK